MPQAGVDRLFRRTSDGTACSGQMSGCFLALALTFARFARAATTLAKARRAVVDERSRSVWPGCMKRSVTASGVSLQSGFANGFAKLAKLLDFCGRETNIRTAYITGT